jgi:hypothetical protein
MLPGGQIGRCHHKPIVRRSRAGFSGEQVFAALPQGEG